ncbi:MAG: hypothetical protein JJU31_10710 [Wenzhouxiangella sp.]|nr:hypothetical protein [Wenzhouxiangella sp.]MCH8476461.1 hypothetical protein [Wenzhouxiangella sp.]
MTGYTSDETIIQAAASPGAVVQRVIFVNSGQQLLLRHLTIRHGFADGSSSISRRGGGIYLDGGQLELEDVILTANRARSDGGAIYNSSGTVTVLNSDIRSNQGCQIDGSCGNGGAINNFSGALTLRNTLLRGNEAGRGGAIYTSGAGNTLSMTNVAVTGNLAANLGGAIANVAGQLQLTNVVFSANRAIGEGGGLHSQSSGATPVIRNSVFWNNQDNSGIGTAGASIFNSALTSTTVSHSLIQGCGGSGGGWNADCGADLGGNVLPQNPGFTEAISPGSTPNPNGYFRQGTASPLINRGNNAYIAGVGTDLDGWARIIDGVVDLGPYEFGNDGLFRDRFEP